MQDLVHSGILNITKIVGETSPSDVFTKLPQADTLKRHLQRSGIVAAVFNQIFSIKYTVEIASTPQQET